MAVASRCCCTRWGRFFCPLPPPSPLSTSLTETRLISLFCPSAVAIIGSDLPRFLPKFGGKRRNSRYSSWFCCSYLIYAILILCALSEIRNTATIYITKFLMCKKRWWFSSHLFSFTLIPCFIHFLPNNRFSCRVSRFLSFSILVTRYAFFCWGGTQVKISPLGKMKVKYFTGGRNFYLGLTPDYRPLSHSAELSFFISLDFISLHHPDQFFRRARSFVRIFKRFLLKCQFFSGKALKRTR